MRCIHLVTCSTLLTTTLLSGAVADSIVPTGLGKAVDRDVEIVRAATERFKDAEQAVAAGYASTTHCVENPPHGGMGLHFPNKELHDAELEVDQPEVLVYETREDGSLQLNGVEYIVPIAHWQKDEPPTVMGQKLKRAERLGIWYLHVWAWKPSPSGLFADWNPDVKCKKAPKTSALAAPPPMGSRAIYF